MKDLLTLVTRPLAPDLRAAIEARYDAELARIGEPFIRPADGHPVAREDPPLEVWPYQVLACFVDALQHLDDADFSFPYADDGIPRGLGWYLCYQLDWKDAREVEWQTRAVARQLGLPSTFTWTTDNGIDVIEGLSKADAWLRPFGYTLLGIVTDIDGHVAVPVRSEWWSEGERLVQQAGFAAGRYFLEAS